MTVSQATFKDTILDPQAPVPAGLINPDGQTASKRFDVYRNNVAVSLSDALETAFPVVRKLVGDQFFRAMAGVYLRKHPPKSPLMMFYGEAMPQFLTRFEPAKSVPYLPDIAKVELALRHAYHAADVASIDGQTLAALAPDALMSAKLRIAPAVHTITSQFPIHAIYRANTETDAPKPVMQAEAVLVTRADFDPQLHLINAAAAECITALQGGKPLGQAMAMTDDTLDLGTVLGLLLVQGAVAEIY
ncbi:DNA-binding domain-containing protein [Cognatiyoonia sp. IB215446]|uniref:HvfC/BufC N-terminal domain-containing protein n=1 Tax=Cognatiyoonia sp. IB215446 TaxID=3097355 RepID=UPI002A13430B|nr:DNA-binding domain-containing protein [Cognatiyoonia sp. IB215446]MDX8348247.1 DNA-binding domain-containing protein [Cognatiyoonia sp. IB215446]